MNASPGIFARWQRVYAEHGIATFPVVVKDGKKKPAVRGYLELGPDVSQQLVAKFPTSDALGFALGRRNKITVLDVDTPDETVLADALVRYGRTPIIVRSGSGNFQAWYQDNGERRRIRPWGPDCPIDVLGEGGYVVAPPSKGARGNYEIIQGSLDDLDRLPVIQGLDGGFYTHATTIKPTPSRNVREGRRNDALFKHCLRNARSCDTFDALLDVARTRNDEFLPPLEDEEVVKAAGSAWKYELSGENRFGRYDAVELASAVPYAFALLRMLTEWHWDRTTFLLAKETADKIGWPLSRFRAARTRLERDGYIYCLSPGGRGPHDPPVYSWKKP